MRVPSFEEELVRHSGVSLLVARKAVVSFYYLGKVGLGFGDALLGSRKAKHGNNKIRHPWSDEGAIRDLNAENVYRVSGVSLARKEVSCFELLGRAVSGDEDALLESRKAKHGNNKIRHPWSDEGAIRDLNTVNVYRVRCSGVSQLVTRKSVVSFII